MYNIVYQRLRDIRMVAPGYSDWVSAPMIRSHDSKKIRLQASYPGMDPVVPKNLAPGWGVKQVFRLRIQSATKENFEFGR